ncbi:hypothetical protein YC2023_094624 [Brassica napus]
MPYALWFSTICGDAGCRIFGLRFSPHDTFYFRSPENISTIIEKEGLVTEKNEINQKNGNQDAHEELMRSPAVLENP